MDWSVAEIRAMWSASAASGNRSSGRQNGSAARECSDRPDSARGTSVGVGAASWRRRPRPAGSRRGKRPRPASALNHLELR